MRILLAYPGHIFSTYDVAVGYEKALTRLGHDVRRFNYHRRIGFYRIAVQAYAEADPTFKRRRNDWNVLASESIILEAVEFVPDVVLIIDGMNLHRRAYDLLRQLHLPVVLLLTESPYHDDILVTIADKGHAVGVLTNDLISVERFSDEVGIPVSYLPHSYDAERHRKRGPVDYFRTDVIFQGTLWPERQRLLMPLAELIDDYEIQIGGIVVEEGREINIGDVLSNNDLAQYYANTKIAINHNRTIVSGDGKEEKHITEAWSLGPRAFEIAACGAFQICDDTRPELHQVFNGYVPTYKNGDELLKLVKHYLTHDDEREKLAAAAHEAVQGCSFDDRARDIVIPFLTEVTNGRSL